MTRTTHSVVLRSYLSVPQHCVKLARVRLTTSSSLSLEVTMVEEQDLLNVIGMTSTETYGKKCSKLIKQDTATATAAANSQHISMCSVGITMV